jgi:hypothetical protein
VAGGRTSKTRNHHTLTPASEPWGSPHAYVQILGQALIESSQHWFSLTQGGETMSIYRSTRPGGFEINIEGQEVTIELLDEDLGRFVQRTIEANFDLAKKKGAQISALRR